MREIKFRAWQEKTNSYEYINSLDDLLMSHDYSIDLSIVEQFTGLKDVNGVEIYEGDIVNSRVNCLFDDGRKNSAIGFRDGSFSYGDTNLDRSMVIAFDIEIIGNIHENQELLEE